MAHLGGYTHAKLVLQYGVITWHKKDMLIELIEGVWLSTQSTMKVQVQLHMKMVEVSFPFTLGRGKGSLYTAHCFTQAQIFPGRLRIYFPCHSTSFANLPYSHGGARG